MSKSRESKPESTSEMRETQTLDFRTFHQLFYLVIPPLNDSARKGTAGRIGIIGGSKNYTGAPYFSAMSSVRVGGDLAYVVCCKEASPVIKSYSPELIVLPILDDESFENEFANLVPKLHSIVVGPGLGRKKEQFLIAAEVIKMAKKYDIPITIDADGVLLIADSPELVKGYTKTILTPNAREFDYLCDKIGIGGFGMNKIIEPEAIKSKVTKLSLALDGVTILRKGKTDIISNGKLQAECSVEGSFRRCGGQGDILAGAIGTFSYWSNIYEKIPTDLKSNNAFLIAAFAGSCLTRRASHLAFRKFGRSMVTSDMLPFIGEAFNSLGFK